MGAQAECMTNDYQRREPSKSKSSKGADQNFYFIMRSKPEFKNTIFKVD